MKNRILFLVDHKYRDLPALALIGHYLKARGRKVFFVACGQEDEAVEEINPGFVVDTKLQVNGARRVKWLNDGRFVLLIDTEGAPKDVSGTVNFETPPDLYFCWGTQAFERYRESLGEHRLLVTGCPRMDFLHPRFSWVLPDKKELCDEMGIDASRPTVTLATSTTYARVSKAYAKSKQIALEKELLDGPDFSRFALNMRNMMDLTCEILSAGLKTFPNVNFVIKPHPNEDVAFWREFVGGLDAPGRIALCLGRTINELLSISDVHVANNSCTTIFEARISGINVIETVDKLSPELYQEEHLNMSNHRVCNFLEFRDALNAEIEKLSASSQRGSETDLPKNMRDYISRHYHKIDGRRCEVHADAINEFMDSREKEVGNRREAEIRPFEETIAPGPTKAQIAWWTVQALVRKLTLFSSEPRTQIQGEHPVRESELDSRGRYDNRIKPGDADAWLSRFEAGQMNMEGASTRTSRDAAAV